MSRSELARSPLLHFVLLGIAVFLLYDLLGDDPREIVITEASLAAEVAAFSRQQGRPPDEAERASLLEGLVAEALLVAEGRALGLDEGDPIVRRRLVARTRLLLQGTAPSREPTDAELQVLIGDRVEPEEVSLEQVFVDTLSMDPGEIPALEADLAAGMDPATLGDPFAHGHRLTAKTGAQLAGLLGEDAAAAVMALPVGGWHPVRSVYGHHLVRVTNRQEARPASLESVRGEVTAQWRQQQREAAEAAALAALRKRYTVTMP